MMSEPRKPVQIAFERESRIIPVSKIKLLRPVTQAMRTGTKYGQIAASVKEVGIIEPLVVVPDPSVKNAYYLLDGHMRLDILVGEGTNRIDCLVATEDEAFTYNKRISRMSIIQEHKMILKAIEKGTPEERIARALNVNVSTIRSKRKLLAGICSEVEEMFKDRQVPINVFTELRKMKSVRQVEAAASMIKMNRITNDQARFLVAATPASQLVEGKAKPKELTAEQIVEMERETANLDREVRAIEDSYGADNLALAVITGFVSKLLDNAAVLRHLAKVHPDILGEFQKIRDAEKITA
ncbi:plasmid partitioning protein RepB C-terminal domain-containing protein [Sphingobium sp. YR768]|uniref:plasmid partitioning protein RepB C-terminal domain-containing protein n=1 Tax=Sphingobium sp. YR768 TaxID=1884365 RepID=UPI0008D410AE|nr:plasmid partitioning protein RepB C-terminal domain-containing protein [Sphingobium sp. YR768]SER82002.1 ParB-like nuclease domain-containing protein [Sphingobium sp. YR768]